MDIDIPAEILEKFDKAIESDDEKTLFELHDKHQIFNHREQGNYIMINASTSICILYLKKCNNIHMLDISDHSIISFFAVRPDVSELVDVLIDQIKQRYSENENKIQNAIKVDRIKTENYNMRIYPGILLSYAIEHNKLSLTKTLIKICTERNVKLLIGFDVKAIKDNESLKHYCSISKLRIFDLFRSKDRTKPYSLKHYKRLTEIIAKGYFLDNETLIMKRLLKILCWSIIDFEFAITLLHTHPEFSSEVINILSSKTHHPSFTKLEIIARAYRRIEDDIMIELCKESIEKID